MPGGSSSHKKRRKGFRRKFYRSKNDVLLHQAIKENEDPNQADETTAETEQIALPQDWQQIGDFDYCKLDKGSNGLRVTVSLTFDSRWIVNVGEKRVPDTCDVLKSLPFFDDQRGLEFVKAIDDAHLCVGHPEEMFVTVVKEKGGVVRGRKGKGEVVADVDDILFVDLKEIGLIALSEGKIVVFCVS